MGLYYCIGAFLLLFVGITLKRRNCERKFLLNCGGVYYHTNRRTNKENLLAAFALLFFWVLTAFRGIDIGNDTVSYVRIFNDILANGIDFNSGIEYGYQILCLVIGFFSSNSTFFLFVIATICYSGVAIYIFKYSKNKMFSVCLFFCVCFSNFTNILRQDIAMVIILFANQAIRDNKKIKALLLIIFASFFHLSAISAILLFLYKFVPKSVFYVFIATIILTIAAITGVLNEILIFIVPTYKNYILKQEFGFGYIALTVDLIRALAIYVLLSYFYGKNRKLLVNYIILLLFSSLGYIATIISRASTYFLLPIIIDIPNAFYLKKIKHYKSIILGVCFIFIAYFIVVLIIRPEWNYLYPYEFFK